MKHLCLVLTVALQQAQAANLARRIGDNFTVASLPSKSLAFGGYDLDDDDDFDPTDLSHITKMAAIGDSYSAGIGAGERLGNLLEVLDSQSDFMCSRFDQSYPYFINNDGRLGDPSKRQFQFRSCSGAVIDDVLTKQIPAIDGGQQVIVLSAGGNDAELTHILNQCIFQWGVFDSLQSVVATLTPLLEAGYEWAKGYDFMPLARGCLGQLAHTRDIVHSNDFSRRLDRVISAAKAKLAPDGMLYYTGYAKFFSETITLECNNVTWTTWLYKGYKIQLKPEMLTDLKRAAMNDLVDLVNLKLEQAVKRAGPQVKFVDYDKYVGQFSGRYCEPGVDESTKQSNTRPGLMFYEPNTHDYMGNTPWKRSAEELHNSSFHGQVNIMAIINLLLDPDATFAVPHANGDGVHGWGTDSLNRTALKQLLQSPPHSKISITNVLPDGYGRVFHPQPLLHRIIANLVIHEMVNHKQVSQNYPAIPETVTAQTCPIMDVPKSGSPGGGTGGGGSGGGSGGGVEKEPDVTYYPGKMRRGVPVKAGTTLRIYMIGDRISALSEDRASKDYTGEVLVSLKRLLSADDVEFAGAGRPFQHSHSPHEPNMVQKWLARGISTSVFETDAVMCDEFVKSEGGFGELANCLGCRQQEDACAAGLMYGYTGRPNIVLVHVGTDQLTYWHNDNFTDSGPISPATLASRVSSLLDLIENRMGGTVVLLAMIIPTSCQGREQDAPLRKTYQEYYELLVQLAYKWRTEMSRPVLAVDFSSFPKEYMDAGDPQCVHPTREGYALMGQMWYDYIHQIPKNWIRPLQWSARRSITADADNHNNITISGAERREDSFCQRDAGLANTSAHC